MDLGGIGSDTPKGNTASLRTLSKRVLGVDLPKSRKLAMSNWAKVPLTNQQVAYAARDAWASAAILHELGTNETNETKKKQHNPEVFSAESLLALLQTQLQECSIQELEEKARLRKDTKTKLFSILRTKDGEKVDRKTLSEEQLEEVGRLERRMKELAPPRPFPFGTV